MVRAFLVFILLTGVSYSFEVKFLTENFYPAGLNLIYVENPKGVKVEVVYKNKKLTFPAVGKRVFFAIPYNPGRLVELNVLRDGKTVYRRFIRVKMKRYPVSKITVKERKLTKEIIKRIKKEAKLLRSIFSKIDRPLFKEDRFIPPLKNPVITTPFGAKRVINGKKRSVHWGVDYKAPMGTPVYASLSGRVELAKELFYTGKTVVINHGGGLFTLYAHLSKITVKEGQMVNAGQIIGKVGSTGRSTGPHLHFGMYVNSVRVDPVMALDLNL